jgi:hypothetical protein
MNPQKLLLASACMLIMIVAVSSFLPSASAVKRVDPIAYPPYSTGGWGNSGGSSGCTEDSLPNLNTGELFAYVNVGYSCNTQAWADVDLHFTAAYSASTGHLYVPVTQEDATIQNNGCGTADLWAIANFYDDTTGKQIASIQLKHWGSGNNMNGGSETWQSQVNVNLVSGHNYHIGIFWKAGADPCFGFGNSYVKGAGNQRDNLDGYNAAHVLVTDIEWDY